MVQRTPDTAVGNKFTCVDVPRCCVALWSHQSFTFNASVIHDQITNSAVIKKRAIKTWQSRIFNIWESPWFAVKLGISVQLENNTSWCNMLHASRQGSCIRMGEDWKTGAKRLEELQVLTNKEWCAGAFQISIGLNCCSEVWVIMSQLQSSSSVGCSWLSEGDKVGNERAWWKARFVFCNFFMGLGSNELGDPRDDSFVLKVSAVTASSEE